MVRSGVLIIVFTLGCAGAATAAHVDGPQPPKPRVDQRDSRSDTRQDRRWIKWWMESKERTELGITDQQSARIEHIFQAALPAQRERWRELNKLDKALAQMIKDSTADVETVTALVNRVEDLRAEMAKTRTVMLYRIHLELSADQRAKLKAMEDRRAEADRRKTTTPSTRR